MSRDNRNKEREQQYQQPAGYARVNTHNPSEEEQRDERVSRKRSEDNPRRDQDNLSYNAENDLYERGSL
ncbi:MAG TPA: hypothetical protein VGD26_12200 [Chitinophagaceae bacterium]